MTQGTLDMTRDNQKVGGVTVSVAAGMDAPVVPSEGIQSLVKDVAPASEDLGAAWQTPASSGWPEDPLSERVARAGREPATPGAGGPGGRLRARGGASGRSSRLRRSGSNGDVSGVAHRPFR